MNKTIREMMAAQAEADAKAKPRKPRYAKDWTSYHDANKNLSREYIKTQAASYDF